MILRYSIISHYICHNIYIYIYAHVQCTHYMATNVCHIQIVAWQNGIQLPNGYQPGGTSELDPDIGLSPSQVGRLVAG